MTMRANEIFKESWPGDEHTHDLDLNTFYKELQNTNSPLFDLIKLGIHPSKRIWRGFGNERQPRIYHLNISDARERTSANTDNYYTWWIDGISKKWNEYPKRSKSFICTNNLDTAADYGAPYLMIPQIKTTIGICPKYDFWDSFGRFEPNHINSELNRLFEESFQMVMWSKIKSLQDFVHTLQLLNGSLRDPTFRKKITIQNDFVELLALKGYDIFKTLDAIFDPNRVGFSVQEWPNININYGKEIWFSAPCYAIHYGMVEQLEAMDFPKGKLI